MVDIVQAIAHHLHSAPLPAGAGSAIGQVNCLKQQLEKEHERRAALYKKHHRDVNAVDGVDTALLTAGMGMGIGGIGLQSTVIVPPILLGWLMKAHTQTCSLP